MSSSSTGTGGIAGQCGLPKESGPCEAAFPAYWHDIRTGVCEPFLYGGCEGNDNRFDSLEACQQACSGGVPDMDACAAPADCTLAAAGCCGACDPVDANAFVAIHRDFADQYASAIGCSGVACGPCPEPSEAERTSQYFTATCEAGRCVVLDVRESPLTECTDSAECALRDGIGCCEQCDGGGIVALNRNADLASLVCDGDVGCPACEPRIPPELSAVCSSGRCSVQIGASP